jgi:hypothetical protein
LVVGAGNRPFDRYCSTIKNTIIMKETIKSQETDWMKDYGVFACNRDSRQFEKTSNVEGQIIELFYRVDQNTVSNELAKHIDSYEDGDYNYTLYNFNHELVGFVYSVE